MSAVVSEGHVSDTCSSGIMSSESDVRWTSVVRGMRGVG